MITEVTGPNASPRRHRVPGQVRRASLDASSRFDPRVKKRQSEGEPKAAGHVRAMDRRAFPHGLCIPHVLHDDPMRCGPMRPDPRPSVTPGHWPVARPAPHRRVHTRQSRHPSQPTFDHPAQPDRTRGSVARATSLPKSGRGVPTRECTGDQAAIPMSPATASSRGVPECPTSPRVEHVVRR